MSKSLKLSSLSLTRFLWMLALMLLTHHSFAQSYTGKMGIEASSDVFVDLVKQSYCYDKPDGAGGRTSLILA
jgi:hypothetical protein